MDVFNRYSTQHQCKEPYAGHWWVWVCRADCRVRVLGLSRIQDQRRWKRNTSCTSHIRSVQGRVLEGHALAVGCTRTVLCMYINSAKQWMEPATYEMRQWLSCLTLIRFNGFNFPFVVWSPQFFFLLLYWIITQERISFDMWFKTFFFTCNFSIYSQIFPCQ